MKGAFQVLCGHLRADGQPCQNPPGCRIKHKRVNRAAEAAVRISAAASVNSLRLERLPEDMRASVIDPLSKTGMLHAPSLGTQYVAATQLMADAETKGLLEGCALAPEPRWSWGGSDCLPVASHPYGPPSGSQGPGSAPLQLPPTLVVAVAQRKSARLCPWRRGFDSRRPPPPHPLTLRALNTG